MNCRKETTVLPVFSINEFNSLTINFKLNFQQNNITVGISAIYRPPARPITEYTKNLETYLDKFEKCQLEIYVGDIKTDLLKKDLADGSSYLNLLEPEFF